MFAATVLVARLLGRAQLGEYATALGIGLFVVSGCGSGLPVLILRETAAKRVNRAVLQNALALELAVTAAATVLATLCAALLIGGKQGALLGLFAGGANVFLSELSLLSSIASGMSYFRKAAFWQATCGVALPFFTYVALKLKLGESGALLAIALAALVASGALYLQLPWSSIPDADVKRGGLFRRSQVFLGIGLIYGGYQRIDAIILFVVSNATTAGLYASAYRFLSPFSLVAQGFGTVFYSKLSARRGTAQDNEAVTRWATALLLLTMLPLAAVVFVITPWLVQHIYGPAFAPAIAPARILLVSLLPFTLYVPTAHALNAANRERRLLRVLLLSTLVEAALVASLAPTFGAEGTAWAWTVTESLILAGVAYEARRSSSSGATARSGGGTVSA